MFSRYTAVCLAAMFLLFLAACRSKPAPYPEVATPAATPGAVTTATAVLTPTAVPTSADPSTTVYLPLTGNEVANPPLGSPDPSPAPTATATVTPTPAFPVYHGPPIARDRLGVQIHLHREDLDQIFYHLRALDVGWVKVQVSWKLHQPAPDRYDEELFWELDRLISRAAAHDIAVMLSVAKAPEWSRPTTEEDGPPTDYRLYEAFMRYLAGRYPGQVAAYELWNEPNLRREWNGSPLSAADFVRLMGYGAAGVRAVDAAAVVISGAPATTGINDGVTAVDDRLYFQQMVAAGAADFVDVFGVHPYGWANPPGSSLLFAAHSPAPSHNNHPSFFFWDTLADYHAILNDAGYGDRQLWVTEFGWGSFDRFDYAPPPEALFMAHVNEWQQAEYILGAYELVTEWDWVGPLIMWNLNFAPTIGPAFSESGYSILRPDGSSRPAYYSLKNSPRSGN
jgi:polysaccharide biosynthesis protein PslG